MKKKRITLINKLLVNNYQEIKFNKFSILFASKIGHLVLCRSIGRESIKYDLDLNSVETVDANNATIVSPTVLERLKNVKQENDNIKHPPDTNQSASLESQTLSSTSWSSNESINDNFHNITGGSSVITNGDLNERTTTIYHIFYSSKYSDSIIYIMVSYYYYFL